MLVTCRKTGRQYDPDQEFQRVLKEHWLVAIMKRLKER
jgi:hypothetical protein